MNWWDVYPGLRLLARPAPGLLSFAACGAFNLASREVAAQQRRPTGN